MALNNGRLDLVSFFKGIAIFMVIVIHTAQPFMFSYWFFLIPKMGLLGCQIFFVLSAFTLCLSFDMKKQTYGAFIKRRVVRLIPGYWTTIVLTQLLSFATKIALKQDYIGVSHKPLDILANFLFINGLLPTTANNAVVRGGWFVGTAFIMYFLFPLLFKIFQNKNILWKKWRSIVFPLILQSISLFLLLIVRFTAPDFWNEHNGFLYNSFINQLPCFSIGFSLFDIYKNQIQIKHSLLKCFFLLLVTVLLFAGSWEYNWILYPITFGASFFYGYCFLQKRTAISTNNTFFDKPLSRLLISMGKVNFGIYLIHAFFAYEMVGFYLRVCNLFVPEFIPRFLLFIVILPVVTLLSWLTGKWYENLLNYIDSKTLKRIFK